MMRVKNVLLAGLLMAVASVATAKGLDSLSSSNPDSAEEGDKGDKHAKGDGDQGEKADAAPKVKSAASKSVGGNLFMSTSFGWINASRGSGTWRSSGMSDVLIGYKVATLSPTMSVAGTYRYAPIGVSGEEGLHSYRGVWEMHNFGGMLNYVVNPSIAAIGTAEVGYVAAHLHSTDGLTEDPKAEKGGVSVGAGGGADFSIGEKNTVSVGPRLRLSFGSFSTVQLAGAFNFLF